MFLITESYLYMTMSKQKKKSILRRFINLNFILWLTLALSIPAMMFGPDKLRFTDNDWDNFSFVPDYNSTEWNILLDSHSHTKYSDGKLTPRQNILWHIAMGFNAMVLTDHNTFRGVEKIREIARNEYDDKIKVFAGLEWTTSRCHLTLIFPTHVTAEEYESVLKFRSYTHTPTDDEIKEVITETKEIGGLVAVNHYPLSDRYLLNQPSRLQFYDWGIDFFEILNGKSYDYLSHKFSLDNGLGVLSATDMHVPGPVHSWTLLNVSEFTEEAIFTELKQKRTSYLFDLDGSPYDVEHKNNPGYIFLSPLIQIGSMLNSMYRSDRFLSLAFVLIGFIYLTFIVLEVLRKLFKP